MLDQAGGHFVSMSALFLTFLRTKSNIVCVMSYHQERRNNPIHEYTEPNLDPDFPLSEDMMQRFKSNLAKNGVHHHKQSNCYRKSKATESVSLFSCARATTRMGYSPIGIDTSTNFPFCSAGPVCSTKLPRIIPIAIARKIQRAKNMSSQPRPLRAELCDEEFDSSWSLCFSRSLRFGL